MVATLATLLVLAALSLERLALSSFPGVLDDGTDAAAASSEGAASTGAPTAGGSTHWTDALLNAATDQGAMIIVAGLVLVLLGVSTVMAVRRNRLFHSRTDGGEEGEVGPVSTDGAVGARRERAVSDEELMTDEELVRKLLEDNGGRMKQVNIVDETGWSKSKVSMLLSDMAEEGAISKLRVGRENIISLDGYEPDAARSPFEEE